MSTSNTSRGYSNRNNYHSEDGEETAYASCMNPEPSSSLMNGAYNFIIFMYQVAYGYHFSHSNSNSN